MPSRCLPGRMESLMAAATVAAIARLSRLSYRNPAVAGRAGEEERVAGSGASPGVLGARRGADCLRRWDHSPVHAGRRVAFWRDRTAPGRARGGGLSPREV